MRRPLLGASLLAGALLAASRAQAAEPAQPTDPAQVTPVKLNPEGFVGVYEAADVNFGAMGNRCVEVADPHDPDAEAIFHRSAISLAWIVRDYPYSADKSGRKDRSEHAEFAVEAYERAFNCDPSWDNRRYLDDALALIRFRLNLATKTEGQDPDSKDLTLLREANTRLSVRRKDLTPPGTPVQALSETPENDDQDLDKNKNKNKNLDAAEERLARRLRILDGLALSVELGTGSLWTTDWLGRKNQHLLLPTFAISPAVRFVLGEEDRHRVHLGFLYGVQSSRFAATAATASTLLAQFDYALAAPSGWLSVHISLGAGYHETYATKNLPETQTAISPGLGICTLDDSLCLRVRGFLRLRNRAMGGGWDDRDYLSVGIGLDPIRLFSRQVRKKSRQR